MPPAEDQYPSDWVSGPTPADPPALPDAPPDAPWDEDEEDEDHGNVDPKEMDCVQAALPDGFRFFKKRRGPTDKQLRMVLARA